jgi:hypothetical protein
LFDAGNQMNFTFAKGMENLGKKQALEVLANVNALKKQGKTSSI